MLLTTDQKGAIAELAIAKAAIALGVGVYRPLSEGGRTDLIFDLGRRLVRVQCKWACRRGEIVSVRCYSARRTAAGLVPQSYTAEEIDAVAAYCLALDRCFFLPTERFPGRTTVQLRLTAARNHQKLGINWADEFDFGATLRRDLGP
jgi:PD-(D/E)XK endonuclease